MAPSDPREGRHLGLPRGPDLGLPQGPDLGLPRGPDLGLPQGPDYGDEVRALLRDQGCEPYKVYGEVQYDIEGTPIWVCPDRKWKFQVPQHIPAGGLANKILGEADIDEHFPEEETDVT